MVAAIRNYRIVVSTVETRYKNFSYQNMIVQMKSISVDKSMAHMDGIIGRTVRKYEPTNNVVLMTIIKYWIHLESQNFI